MEEAIKKLTRENPEFWTLFFEELKKDCRDNYYCSDCKIKKICDKAKKEVKEVTGRKVTEWRTFTLSDLPNRMFKHAVFEKKKREQYINI